MWQDGGSGFWLQFQFVEHNERFNRNRACVRTFASNGGDGRKSVFRNLFGRFHFVSGTLTVAQSPISISSCVWYFFLHTFESHVIYGLHFHAYTKHVVPLAAEAVARTIIPIFRMPSPLRYVTKVSLRSLVYICIQFRMGIISLPLNCIDANVKMWIV